MDCKVKWIFYLGLSWLLVAEKVVDASCIVSQSLRASSCEYKVICQNIPSGVSSPNCDNSNKYNVTFIIENSELQVLTAGFFSTTNFDSRVRTIIVRHSSWTTIETSAFRYYSKVLSVDLSSTGIYNINIEAFSSLSNIKTLNLSHNHLTYLYPTSLRISITSPIQVLDLSHNRLKLLQNQLFSFMSVLSELNLEGNLIHHIDDDCFIDLKSLNILNLYNNNLTSFNSSLTALRSLKHLELSYNSVARLRDYEVNSLRSLEYFNMSNNALEVVEARCFYQANNLQIVDFSNNRIHTPIESTMFMSNNYLKYINFYNNSINTIQDYSFAFSQIEYINFERNNLTGFISGETFKGLLNVTSLNLYNQNIIGVKDNAFSTLNNLKYLNLSENHINIVENASFVSENGNSLQILDLSHNYLESIQFFKYFKSNLTKLYLNYNKLMILPENVFKNHSNLILLDVSYNEIAIIEQYSVPLKNLQYFYVHGNKLNGNITDNIFSHSQYLRSLDLSHLNLNRIEEFAFIDLPLLAKLNLSHNELVYLDAENFNGIGNMHSLDLSYNRITNLTLNGNFSNLKTIYLNNNNFSELPNIFPNKSLIIHIDVSNNRISDINNSDFENVTDLKILKMSHNNLTNFNNEQTNALSKLNFLALSSNRISEIKLSYFKDLTYLDLSSNVIKLLNITTFDNLDSLQYLDLSGNDISEILPGTFQNQKELRLLNLSSNYLTNLRYGIFRGLNKTDTLDLSRNKLTYLDIHIFHECSELRLLLIDYNYLKTIDIERLPIIAPNLTSLSLGGNLMSCKEIVRTLKNQNITLTVTAIDKFYHEDNVHGIKCGGHEDYQSERERAVTSYFLDIPTAKPEGNSSTSSNILIWCSILTVISVISANILWYYKYKKIKRRRPTLQLSDSTNIDISQGEQDLLS